jgi:hypothetical protein
MISRPVMWLGAALFAVLLAPPRAHAQDANGFFFRAPAGAVTFRGGFDRANAGSDLFAFATEQLTLKRRDFSSMTFATDVDYRMTPRLDLALGVSISKSTTPSEFRHWLDNNDRSIEQTTEFIRVPLTASLKAYLADPGRSVGHFAWIPSRYAPYVGAGGGVLWSRFEQSGDFIDFATTRVFSDDFKSQGWTPTVQAFVGTDVSLNPRFAVTTEARYQWARSRLDRDFSGFDRIDLSGFALTAGISIRY